MNNKHCEDCRFFRASPQFACGICTRLYGNQPINDLCSMQRSGGIQTVMTKRLSRVWLSVFGIVDKEFETKMEYAESHPIVGRCGPRAGFFEERYPDL